MEIDMAIHDFTPSRRSILGAIATAPIIAAPAAASAMSPSTGISPLIERHRMLREQHRVWGETVHDVVMDRYEAAVAAIPHQTTKANFMGLHETTERQSAVRMARELVNGGDDDFDGLRNNDAYMVPQRELVELANLRDKEVERLRHMHGVPELLEYDERVGDEIYDALMAVILAEVHTADELVAKIEFARENDEWDRASLQDALIADIRRIMPPALQRKGGQ
jgi:hypothetical protein